MIISRIQQFSVIFAFIMISWAMLPFFGYGALDNVSIATSLVLMLIGIAYPLSLFKPQWNKALLLAEGIIFAVVGLIFLKPYDILFLIIGLGLVILAILAYMRKLPNGLLKFFYKSPK
ncbi:MAG: hypothetical protein LBU74_05665 [Methanobacteriaceae archaeon]|jgi:hypothetical protein|nr:hypothetical protein [Candidatus Methanorudis spinitermitis]